MHVSSALRSSFLKRSSYYDSDYRPTAALLRARRPYLFKNMITGAAIMSFAIGVFVFTLRAVGQETFEDVVVPDTPRQPPKTPNVQTNGIR